MAKVLVHRKALSFISAIAFCFVCVTYAGEGEPQEIHSPPQDEVSVKKPTILIPILARNKAHTLPSFLAYLENFNYPKNRISLWIRADHSIDDTIPMLREWVQNIRHYYHSVDFEYSESPKAYALEKGPHDWPQARFHNLIALREGALEAARKQWADYLFAVDVDNFLFNPDILNILIAENRTIIAPMLRAHSFYSNFWGGVNSKGYYKRTKEYIQILRRNITGVFKVPMVHSTYLINLRHEATDRLTYRQSSDYELDLDDMLTFSHSARKAGIPFYVINTKNYGALLIPPDSHHPIKEEIEQMIHTRLEAMVEGGLPIPTSPFITLPEERPADKMGFDEIYMINLERRPQRRRRMLASLDVLRIKAKVWDAVDGKLLSPKMLKEMGIDMLPGYADPYWGRVLTKGEIGCFLSHYHIWQDVIKHNYSRVIVFEDDVRFLARFRPRLTSVMAEVASRKLDWDLIYIGRKILHSKEEEYLPESTQLVRPSYSYWTLSYMLTLEGAKKLMAQEPLGKMIPVDEYLPIMFDKHPQKKWAEQFNPRDLKAYSVDPLMVAPTHYTGEPNYFSDTETSSIWEELKTNGRGKPGVNNTETAEEGLETIPGDSTQPSDKRKDTPSTVTQINQDDSGEVVEHAQKHSQHTEL